jgi:hypothetical protein
LLAHFVNRSARTLAFPSCAKARNMQQNENDVKDKTCKLLSFPGLEFRHSPMGVRGPVEPFWGNRDLLRPLFLRWGRRKSDESGEQSAPEAAKMVKLYRG